MTQLYIDVPDNHKYDWAISKDCREVLRIEHNFKSVTFICNAFGKRSKGDLYRIELWEEYDEILFFLRTGFVVCEPPVVD